MHAAPRCFVLALATAIILSTATAGFAQTQPKPPGWLYLPWMQNGTWNPVDPALDPAAQQVLCAEDTYFSSYNGPVGQLEWGQNYGLATRLRVKGWENVAAFKFSTLPQVVPAGQTIDSAELHVAFADGASLNAMVAATINSDWRQGSRPDPLDVTGSTLATPGDSCYRWRSVPLNPNGVPPQILDYEWTFWHSDFSTASFGNYGSLVCFGYAALPVVSYPAGTETWDYRGSNTFITYRNGDGLSGIGDGDGCWWYAMKLDPDLVNALAIGDQYGLAVTDPRAHYPNNPRIFSLEQFDTTQPAGPLNPDLRPRLYIKFKSGGSQAPVFRTGAILTAEPGFENGLEHYPAGGAERGPGPKAEVVLKFEAPRDGDAPERNHRAFGYNVWVQGSDTVFRKVARWRIPRPGTAWVDDATPGEPQRILIEDVEPVYNTDGTVAMPRVALQPGQTYTFYVQAYDAAGNGMDDITTITDFTTVPNILSMAYTVPLADPPLTLATSNLSIVPSAPVREAGTMRYWAAPEVTKVNPFNGNRMEDGYAVTATAVDPDAYKQANVVWDSATNTISLAACRNEVAAAQLLIENKNAGVSPLNNVEVTVSDLVDPAVVDAGGNPIPILADPNVSLYELHYVKYGLYYYPDAAIPLQSPPDTVPPLPSAFDVPDAARYQDDPNFVSQQKVQSIWIDIYIPKTAAAGSYSGTVHVSSGGISADISLNVLVSSLTTTDSPTFQVDLNSYGRPWEYTDPLDASKSNKKDLTLLRYFQETHKHRATFNPLPYTYTGQVYSDRDLTFTGEGSSLHVAVGGWDLFDMTYGRFLDGSAFRPATVAHDVDSSGNSITTPSPYTGPGQNTPTDHMYTPFHEMWPTHTQANQTPPPDTVPGPIALLDPRYGFDPYQEPVTETGSGSRPLKGLRGGGGLYWSLLIDWNSSYFFYYAPDLYPTSWKMFKGLDTPAAGETEPAIDGAMPTGYADAVRNITEDWLRHAVDEGWVHTQFQSFLYNKYYFTNCPSLWVLRECESGDDFRAVGYFQNLYRQARDAAIGSASTPAEQDLLRQVKWQYRYDISDRWGQNYGQVDNAVDLQMVAGGAASWCWPNLQYRSCFLDTGEPEQWHAYGIGSAIYSRGIGFAQTFLQKWCQGFDGAMPCYENCQTSWTTANSNSVVYSGQSIPGYVDTGDLQQMYDGCVISSRLKMIRQTAQVIELLNMWVDREAAKVCLPTDPMFPSVVQAVRPKVRDALCNWYVGKYGSDTWDYAFYYLDDVGFYQLKADLIAKVEPLPAPVAAIESSPGKAGDVNGDGHVNVGDLQVFVAAWGSFSSSRTWKVMADLNFDNYVNVGDLQLLVTNWGK